MKMWSNKGDGGYCGSGGGGVEAIKSFPTLYFNANCTLSMFDASPSPRTTKPSTFEHQNVLPKLPIPSLEKTCQLYLETLEPIQCKEDHEKTKEAVASFLSSEGPILQKKLLDYAKDKNSYIEEFWDSAYLNTRSSVVLSLNPFFVLEDDPTPSKNNQISRASSLIFSALKFIQALRNESLDPDIWRNVPLCMHQFRTLFGSARIPGMERDTMTCDPESRHIVILSRSQFYWFDVLWKDNALAISEKEISHNLRDIVEDSLVTNVVDQSINSVGVLSATSRASWAELRLKLLENNQQALDIVDRALFLVCIDDTSPPSAEEFAATALHGTYKIVDGLQVGTCTNRWYDKLQIIVCENGVAGVNFEHSYADGHTVLRFVSDIFTDTIIRFAQTIRGGTVSIFENSYRDPKTCTSFQQQPSPDIAPKRLEWIISKEVRRGIKYAESNLSDLILQNEVKVLEFTSYGKNFIVQNSLSPDAYVQMAFVASYYALYGEAANTYEPVLTKRFKHGRTEAARSLTRQAKLFIHLFLSDASPLDKLQAFREAIQAHVNMVKRCANGGGIDRHLYALYCIQEKENGSKASLFCDKGWDTLGHTTLSTSNCGNPSLRLFGFGPVVSDGFGIGYIIKDEGIQFCASSKHRQTSRFLDTLESFLSQVQQMLIQEKETLYPNLLRSHLKRRPSTSLPPSTGYSFFGDCPVRETSNSTTPSSIIGTKI